MSLEKLEAADAAERAGEAVGLVEGVARALCRHDGEDPDGELIDACDNDLRAWHLYEARARMAVAALAASQPLQEGGEIAEAIGRFRGDINYLKSDKSDLGWPEALNRPGSATRAGMVRDLSLLINAAEGRTALSPDAVVRGAVEARAKQQQISRYDAIETEARALLEGVDDALKLKGNRLKVCSRTVLEGRCDNLAAALHAEEATPALPVQPEPVQDGAEGVGIHRQDLEALLEVGGDSYIDIDRDHTITVSTLDVEGGMWSLRKLGSFDSIVRLALSALQPHPDRKDEAPPTIDTAHAPHDGGPAPAPPAEPVQGAGEVALEDQAFDDGERQGYDKAMQELDEMTGGDGLYFASTNGNDCRDGKAMRDKIVERFEGLSAARQSAPAAGVVEEMREALRPFAGAGEQFDTTAMWSEREAGIVFPDTYQFSIGEYEDGEPVAKITLGELRRAAALLSKLDATA